VVALMTLLVVFLRSILPRVNASCVRAYACVFAFGFQILPYIPFHARRYLHLKSYRILGSIAIITLGPGKPGPEARREASHAQRVRRLGAGDWAELRALLAGSEPGAGDAVPSRQDHGGPRRRRNGETI